jgi:NRPS condensation-like uncharacterized protein
MRNLIENDAGLPCTAPDSPKFDYTAEVFDQMQRLYAINGFNDHQIHCVLRFEFGPDAELLRKAVAISIETVPILGTRYVDGARPRWTRLDLKEYSRAFVTTHSEMEFEEFVASRVDECFGPQIRVCLLDSTPYAIALKMNHMVCDAAGFKTYLYLLCQIYSGLIADPQYKPSAIKGDRSIRCVLKRFGLGVKLKSLLLQSDENNLTGGDQFPLSSGGEKQSFVLTRNLGRDRTESLKDYGRASNATLNDIVLTAYYRCLFRILGLSPGATLQIPVMVDMRRYLGKIDEPMPLTNLASTVITHLEYRQQESFEETLRRVKATMDEKKASNLGLNAFVKLSLIYRIFGDRIANRLLRSRLTHPLLGMTNVGVLDSSQLSFGNLRPCDAFLCGSIKYKPYFQLAISSFQSELTLSVNLCGSASDQDQIRTFFDEIDSELPR